MVLVIHFNFLKVETPYVPSGGVSFFSLTSGMRHGYVTPSGTKCC